jgi:hypothetical protein
MNAAILYPICKGAYPVPQRGAALVITLIFLMLMTMVGVSTLMSSRFGQDIASNFQETNRAFQTAETGIVVSLGDNNWTTDSGAAATGADTAGLEQYSYQRDFNDFYPLTRRKDQIYSSIHFQRAQFSVTSSARIKPVADADPIAKTTVREGVYLVVPKL